MKNHANPIFLILFYFILLCLEHTEIQYNDPKVIGNAPKSILDSSRGTSSGAKYLGAKNKNDKIFKIFIPRSLFFVELSAAGAVWERF